MIEINTLIAERDALKVEVTRLTSSAICAFCGGVVSIECIALHVELCDKHPVRQLRAENERAQVEYSKSLNNLGYENAGLKSENARMRAALERYADEDNWRHPDRNIIFIPNGCMYGYDIAQEALEGK